MLDSIERLFTDFGFIWLNYAILLFNLLVEELPDLGVHALDLRGQDKLSLVLLVLGIAFARRFESPFWTDGFSAGRMKRKLLCMYFLCALI